MVTTSPRLALVLALASAPGCGDDGAPAGVDASTSTDRSFTQLVGAFDDLATCQAQAPEGLNCLRSLALCANGGYVLVVTDITNEGTYTTAGASVTATQRAPGDGPDTFTLTLTASGFTSPELDGRHPWTLEALDAEAARLLADECDSLTGRTWWP